MKKLLAIALTAYLSASALASVAYNLLPCKWGLASRRGVLIIVSIDQDGVWVLNPLSPYADDWIIGLAS